MGDALKWVIAVLVLLAIGATIGLAMERSRRRQLVALAREHGGTFEPGSLMEGTPVPEAAPFDAPVVVMSTGDESDDGGDPPASGSEITYRNVVRIPGTEASYVVALRRYGSSNTKGEWKTTSYVVCFVTLARSDLPALEVFAAGPGGFEWADGLMGTSKPAAVELPDPVPGFAKHFEVHVARGAARPTREALDQLLDRRVQAELDARRNLIAGLRVHGSVVRLQAVGTPGNDVHRELYELARKLAIIWAGKGRP